MKDNRTHEPPNPLDEFERERTAIFDGEVVEGVWGRETTRFAAGPVRAEAFLRESTPLDWIDPSEFDHSGPNESGAYNVPHTPVSQEADELLMRLRSGEFTDPNIKIDEFDEDLETRYEPRNVDATLEDFSQASVADALERRLDARAEPRANQASDSILARVSTVSRPDTKAGCEELASALDAYIQPMPVRGSADAEMEGLLSEYLAEKPKRAGKPQVESLLADYLRPAQPVANILRSRGARDED